MHTWLSLVIILKNIKFLYISFDKIHSLLPCNNCHSTLCEDLENGYFKVIKRLIKSILEHSSNKRLNNK